jgi:hypothetical protein
LRGLVSYNSERAQEGRGVTGANALARKPVHFDSVFAVPR